MNKNNLTEAVQIYKNLKTLATILNNANALSIRCAGVSDDYFLSSKMKGDIIKVLENERDRLNNRLEEL